MPDQLKENLSKEEVKEATKDAIKEWMDEKFIQVGKWSVSVLTVAALGALTYFILVSNGWRHK